ncbi:hypothetical protein J6590_029448 [Homalodisca vitripennis]|nr:hypothetical protein J6590_029448 [Homalodisca vitripennis]
MARCQKTGLARCQDGMVHSSTTLNPLSTVILRYPAPKRDSRGACQVVDCRKWLKVTVRVGRVWKKGLARCQDGMVHSSTTLNPLSTVILRYPTPKRDSRGACQVVDCRKWLKVTVRVGRVWKTGLARCQDGMVHSSTTLNPLSTHRGKYREIACARPAINLSIIAEINFSVH